MRVGPVLCLRWAYIQGRILEVFQLARRDRVRCNQGRWNEALAHPVLMACLQKGIISFMARQKTTIYLEPDLLRATKTLAASSGRRDYEVIEEALRAYMRSEEAAAGRRQLQEMLDRWGQSGDGLAENDALELASREVRAVRRERRARG